MKGSKLFISTMFVHPSNVCVLKPARLMLEAFAAKEIDTVFYFETVEDFFVKLPKEGKVLVICSRRLCSEPSLYAGVFAKQVKEINPDAVIIAYTLSDTEETDLGSLDGYIPRSTQTVSDLRLDLIARVSVDAHLKTQIDGKYRLDAILSYFIQKAMELTNEEGLSKLLEEVEGQLFPSHVH